MNKLTKKILLLLALFTAFFFSTKAIATTMENSDDMEILAEDRMIYGPAFLSGNLVRVDGVVNGTAFVAGETVQINGIINGDLFIAAQNVFITGEVTGNIYFVGMTIILEGEVTRDTFLAGQTITISEDARVGRDLFTLGNTIIQEGTVERHMFGAGNSIILTGTIGGNGDFNTDRLTLGSESVIEGNLVYRSEQEATTETGAEVQGETDFRRSQRRQRGMDTFGMRNKIAVRIWFLVWSVLSAALIWFVIKWLRPTSWERTIRPLLERPGITLGVGLLAFVVTPLLAILIMFTIIGLPLGFLILTGYGILLYLAKIFVSVAVALAVSRRTNQTGRGRAGWLVVLSLLILGLLGMVPVLNFFVMILVAIAGLGTFVMSHIKKDARVS